MSEQKLSYMAQLDCWSSEHVIAPLLDNGVEAIERVQKAIRQKVLESYRNGQAKGPTKPVSLRRVPQSASVRQ